MRMNTCKICNTELDSKRAKICKQQTCISAWKKTRNANLPPKTRQCKQCRGNFETSDARNNFCGTECKTLHTRITNHERYGYANTANAWNREATVEELEAAHNLRTEATRKSWSESKDAILEKRNQTNLEKFGVSNTFNLPKSVSARKATVLAKYKTNSVRIAGILIKNDLKDYDAFCDLVINYIEAQEVNPFSVKVKDWLKDQFEVTYEVINDVLRHTQREDLMRKFKSSQEKEINKFLLSVLSKSQIKVNTRPKFMLGKELDFYIPDHNLAIEFHGLAHHSERDPFQSKTIPQIKKQHEDKYLSCKKEGVKLVQIFEDEWTQKPEILKSMILNRLGLTKKRIHARKGTVIEVDPRSSRTFFEDNHVSGSTNAVKTFGLLDADSNLVCCLSLRKTWNKAYGERLEIARFASKLNTSVVGGFQRLLKRVTAYTKKEGLTGLLTYADCRFGSGLVYHKSGFNHVRKTKPNYFYEKGGIRENRFKHRKSKVLIGSTEREQQNLLGWYAIYDAGNEVYLLDI